MKKRITIRGIPIETVDLIGEIREHEGRFTAKIVEDAVYEYWSEHYAEEEETSEHFV